MKSKFLLILHKSCLSTQFAKFSVQKTREVRQIDENFLHFLVNFSLLPTDVIFEKKKSIIFCLAFEHTVRKFKNFTAAQILREIKVG